MGPWQPTAAIGCRGGCYRMSLLDKGKRRIQADIGCHRKMRRVCLSHASPKPTERLNGETPANRLPPSPTPPPPAARAPTLHRAASHRRGAAIQSRQARERQSISRRGRAALHRARAARPARSCWGERFRRPTNRRQRQAAEGREGYQRQGEL
jgi:hypothetical protein